VSIGQRHLVPELDLLASSSLLVRADLRCFANSPSVLADLFVSYHRFSNAATYISLPHAATNGQCSVGISVTVLPSSASSIRYIPNASTPIHQSSLYASSLFLDGPGLDAASCLKTTLRLTRSMSCGVVGRAELGVEVSVMSRARVRYPPSVLAFLSDLIDTADSTTAGALRSIINTAPLLGLSQHSPTRLTVLGFSFRTRTRIGEGRIWRHGSGAPTLHFCHVKKRLMRARESLIKTEYRH